MKYRAL